MAPPVCPDDAELLAPALDRSTASGVREHVDTCPYCRQRMGRLLAEITNLRQVFQKAATRTLDTLQSNRATTFMGRPVKETGEARETLAPDPEVIDKYKVLALLGEGGQALVYRVVHPGLNKELVLKLSRRPVSGERIDRDRLVQEARLLADLDHSNLARVYDVGFWEDRPFVVMEYVRGRTLAETLRGGRPSPRQAAALVAQLARALAAAHRAGVVHLDLKPSNIMIDEAGRPRVLDFGMARLSVPYTGESPAPAYGGTPDYMAPEQARGDQKGIGPATDVFALGGILYEMLIGQPPFQGVTAQEALQRARRCQFDRTALRRAGVPRALERVCLQVLTDDPAARPTNAGDLAANLERYVNRPRRWKRLIVASMVLLALGSAAAYFLLAREFPTGPQFVISRIDRGQGAHDLLTALPLQSGDQLHIDCPLPRGFQPRLFTCDVDGKWESYTAFTIKSAGRFDRLQADVRWTGDKPGTRVLLVCAGRSQLPENLPQNVLADQSPWEALPASPRLLLWMNRDAVKVEMAVERQPLVPAQKTALSRAEDRLERLGQQLRGHCEYFVAVVYPHAGA